MISCGRIFLSLTKSYPRAHTTAAISASSTATIFTVRRFIIAPVYSSRVTTSIRIADWLNRPGVVADVEIKKIVKTRSRRVPVRERTDLQRFGRFAVREEDVPDSPDDRRVVKRIRARLWRDLRAGFNVRGDDNRRDAAAVDVVLKALRCFVDDIRRDRDVDAGCAGRRDS